MKEIKNRMEEWFVKLRRFIIENAMELEDAEIMEIKKELRRPRRGEIG